MPASLLQKEVYLIKKQYSLPKKPKCIKNSYTYTKQSKIHSSTKDPYFLNSFSRHQQPTLFFGARFIHKHSFLAGDEPNQKNNEGDDHKSEKKSVEEDDESAFKETENLG